MNDPWAFGFNLLSVVLWSLNLIAFRRLPAWAKAIGVCFLIASTFMMARNTIALGLPR